MRKLEKTLVLVGMMGAGKTSVGRRLATVLGVPFRDADAEIELLLERVIRKDTRPLLRNTDRRAALERLLKEREPIYAEADISVESEGGPHEIVVKRILAALESQERAREPRGLGAHS